MLFDHILDAVNIGEVDIFLEDPQGGHGRLIFRGPFILGSQSAQGIAVQHGGRGVGDIQHPVLDQGDHGLLGLAHHDKAQGGVNGQQENGDDHQHPGGKADPFCSHKTPPCEEIKTRQDLRVFYHTKGEMSTIFCGRSAKITL